MLVCHACTRHYRFEDVRCPFCSTPHRSVSASLGAAAALATGLMLFACTGDDEGETSDTSESDTTDTTDTTGETGDETTDTDSGDTTTSTTDTGGEEYGGAPPAEPADWR